MRKNRVAHQADRTVVIVDRTLDEPFIGELADIALGAEGDAPFFRKKLFRSEATASTRLSEQNKLIGANFHIDSAPVEHLPMTSVACKSNPHGKFCAGMNAFRTG